MKPRYVYKWGVGPVRVEEIRGRFRDDGKRLRRARRLYMWLCYDAIMSCDTERKLWYVADRCKRGGIYADCAPPRDIAFGILGHLFKIAKHKGFQGGWHQWIYTNDFQINKKEPHRTRHIRYFEVA